MPPPHPAQRLDLIILIRIVDRPIVDQGETELGWPLWIYSVLVQSPLE